MEYDIRRLSFAEVFDRSLRILVDNAALLVGLAIFLGIPSQALPRGHGWPEVLRWAFYLLWTPFYGAALASTAADIYLNRHTTVGSAFKTARSIFLPYLGTFVIVQTVFVSSFALFVASTMVTRTLGASIGAAVAIPGFVWLPISFFLWIRWILHAPVMVVERCFVLSALRRSSALVRDAWWRTLGIFVVIAVIELGPVRIFGMLWSSVPVVGTLLGGLVASVCYAYVAIVLTVYYFDRRCRIEDFDLRHLAEQIRAESAPPPALTAAPSIE